MNKKIIVIGSGFGGIAAALRMRSKGYDVTLVEKHPDLGGRARVFKKDGFVFDAGPTVITAPNLLEELFELFNKKISEKREFNDTRYSGKILDIAKEAERLCNSEFELSPHQQFVKNFLSFQTPYNSLLLYHGLGSGKTCSSIAIAEGIKNDKKVMVLTPASLRDNYVEELKKCGDYLYKKNQYWEFINIKKNPDMSKYLSKVLGLQHEYILKNEGY